MPARLPILADFPSSLHLTITPPPSSQPVSNVLILFHGLGDTNVSFTSLARNLSLPETACISLQALTPLPFDLGGFYWGDDIVFDQNLGQMEFDTGFSKITKVVTEDIIRDGLVGKCGLQMREIMLLGFGQGGMAALAVAAAVAAEMGGVISIGGPVPADVKRAGESKATTPVLLLGGSSRTLVTSSALAKAKGVFAQVEYKKWAKTGDRMPGNREEMMPIMQFFARRLRSRRGVPEESVEIG